LIIDPNDTATYWSGGNHYNGSVYCKSVAKSTNAGTNWVRYDLTSATGFCKGIAVDPTDSDIVYAAGYPGFHKTTNGGNSWDEIGGGISGNTYAVVIDPSDPSVVYTGGTNGVFKSTDSGDNWINVGLNDVNAIAIDPGNHDVVYAGTTNGVYASTDGGATWDAMNDGLEDLGINSLGIFPGAYLFCGADVGGMYRWDIYTGMEELGGYHSTSVLRATPNPMRHSASITYYLPNENHVTLAIYDAQGRLVRELVSAQQTAGTYTRGWDGIDAYGAPVAAGVYFCRLMAGKAASFLKIVVTR